MINALHASSKKASKRISTSSRQIEDRVVTLLSSFYYEKFAVITWCLLMIVCLALFVGGISSSHSSSGAIQNSCLLYASPPPNLTFTSPANETFLVQLGKNEALNFSGNNACHSAVIEGVAAIMLTIFVTLVTFVYLYSSPTKQIAQAVAYMSFILTIFLVAIVGIANIGLYQTCANSPLCSGDGSNYLLVFAAVIAGWTASALLFVFTACAWFNVGTHSKIQSNEHRFSATLLSPEYDPANRYSTASSVRSDRTRDYKGKRSSTMSDIPAWRPLSLNINPAFGSALKEEL